MHAHRESCSHSGSAPHWARTVTHGLSGGVRLRVGDRGTAEAISTEGAPRSATPPRHHAHRRHAHAPPPPLRANAYACTDRRGAPTPLASVPHAMGAVR